MILIRFPVFGLTHPDFAKPLALSSLREKRASVAI
jgi:hypothetical protein